MQIVEGSYRELTDDERETVRVVYPDRDFRYVCTSEYICTHEGRCITVKCGFMSDGASSAPDFGISWWFHDWLYATHQFDDGTPCSRRRADIIMCDVLIYENDYLYYAAMGIASWLNPFKRFSWSYARSGAQGPKYWLGELNPPNDSPTDL